MKKARYVNAAHLTDLQAKGCQAIQVGGHTIALFVQDGNVYAVDNRCPHMGFPLHRGTVKDGILTCHWHHARFDLASGGTFDLWADDVRMFPVELRGDEVWVDLAPAADVRSYYTQRLHEGLERDLSLVIGKAVINLLNNGEDPVEPFKIGLDFGARYRQAGWGQGLTIHTCMMNLLPHLHREDQSRALYHGLSAVASESAGEPPRFTVSALPTSGADFPTLKRRRRLDSGKKEPFMEKVNLRAKFDSVSDAWVPRVVAEPNGQYVKVVKFDGPYVWHHHDEEDEMFLVTAGHVDLEFRDHTVGLDAGEFCVVPRGVEHRPVAESVAEVLLFEPATTRNTGQVDHEYTIEAQNLERL